jgi:hypothetical protein
VTARLEAKARQADAVEKATFRVTAYRLCQHVRDVQDALGGRKVGVVYHPDRAAWSDLRDAHERLTALIAQAPAPEPLP